MPTSILLVLSAVSLLLLILLFRFGGRTSRKIRQLDEELSRGPSQTISLDTLIENVEADREKFLVRAKKVFPRAYVRIVIGLFLFIVGGMLLVMGLTSETDVPLSDLQFLLIGAPIMSAIAGLLVAGFFTMLRRGKIWTDFSTLMKLSVLPFLLREQGSRLSYRAEGITAEEWDQALLYTSGIDVTSSDRFAGQAASGRTVQVSEVVVESYDRNDDPGEKGRSVRFRGLFVMVDLPRSVDQPLQAIPTSLFRQSADLPEVLKSILRTTRSVDVYRRFLWQPLRKADAIPVPGAFAERFVALSVSRDSSGADESHELTPEQLARMGDAAFQESYEQLHRIAGNAAVCLSVVGSRLNIGIDLNRDFFEAEAFLKTSFKESGTIERLRTDLAQIATFVEAADAIAEVFA